MNIRDIDDMFNDHKHRRLAYFNLQTVFYFKYIKNPHCHVVVKLLSVTPSKIIMA